MKTKNILSSVVILAVFLFLSFFIFLLYRETETKRLPVLGEVADFVLYDTNDREITLGKLRGKVWVADFIFTSCGDLCPLMTKNMAALHRAFLADDQVHLVSISVDPETDSPSALARYAKKYNADTRTWHFLTGPRETIQKLSVESFKIGSLEEPIFHSDRFVLVDAKARIRGYYEGRQPQTRKTLLRDIGILLKEKP